MRTTQRLKALKAWAEKNLCEGRLLKSPAANMDITQLTMEQPRVFLGWMPSRPDMTGMLAPDPKSICPGILIAPSTSYAKYVEEQRFDRYQKVHRAQAMGQQLAVSILFAVYEPGVRLPGFEQNPFLENLMEGTEEGLFTLTNWMDDCVSQLLADGQIPGSDLFLQTASLMYSPYMDSQYVVDKRPVYYGFVNAVFSCYADDRNNSAVEAFLK